MAEQRLHVLLEPIGELLHSASKASGGDDDADLDDGHGEGRHRDDAEEYLAQRAHAFSRERACWYASRPRSIAVDSVSRP